ncbi:MAG: hypothetical protein WBQ29_24675, partial [Isosphaeraceae bacterium]
MIGVFGGGVGAPAARAGALTTITGQWALRTISGRNTDTLLREIPWWRGVGWRGVGGAGWRGARPRWR